MVREEPHVQVRKPNPQCPSLTFLTIRGQPVKHQVQRRSVRDLVEQCRRRNPTNLLATALRQLRHDAFCFLSGFKVEQDKSPAL
jgi:hypothetical protein